MNVSDNFKLIGISMLVIVGLAACGKQATADRMNNPDEFLQHLVSTNAVVLGTVEGEASPSIEISFSNGHMGRDFMPGGGMMKSGPALPGTTPYATCVGFTGTSFRGAKNDLNLCVTVRDFEYRGVVLKRGDLYIADEYGRNKYGDNPSGIVYHARVK